jgi:cytochrome c5
MKLAIIGIAAAATLFSIGQVAAADGKAVYEKSCKGCHSGMSPKLGDKAAWTPLAKRGAKDLTASVMKGKGAMPPKGGAESEADVSAAVGYMIGAAK